MANRNTLHVNHLSEFSKWLIVDGWTVEQPKGDYEVLRARKGNRFMPVYKKYDSDHLSVADSFGGVIRTFIKSKKSAQ